MIGRIKHWNGPRGYGWIVGKNGGPDLFTHITSIQQEGKIKIPQPGDVVSYETELNPKSKRPQACSVYIQPRGSNK